MQKLANNLNSKHFIPISGKTKNSDYTMEFIEDIPLHDGLNYKIGLIWLQGVNSFFNINESNNKLKYHNGIEWKETVELPPGGYGEIKDINNRIKELIDNKEGITLNADPISLRTSFKLTNNYKIDFTIAESFNKLIGFTPSIIEKQGVSYSSTVVELKTVKAINMNCNLVSNFYINGRKSNVLYSSPIPVPLGYDFEIAPKNIIWLPINTKSFNSINFRFTNENNELINFRGYDFQFLALIRQI